LLENNVQKLSPERWARIVSTFVHLFKTTTAYQLFDPTLLLPQPEDAPQATPDSGLANGFVDPTPLSPVPATSGAQELDENGDAPAPIVVADRRRIFRQIIVKCVLQLLLIETTHELLQNEGVYTTIPPVELLKLMASLDDSYRFARKFNGDKDLRMALWKVGFMRDLPNLLRQESTSAATLVNVLLRMYNDTAAEHVQKRADVINVFSPSVPLSLIPLMHIDWIALQTRTRRSVRLRRSQPREPSSQHRSLDTRLRRDPARILFVRRHCRTSSFLVRRFTGARD
jgi:brefeldin A-inhibited guanine nucleotide-exchange protein